MTGTILAGENETRPAARIGHFVAADGVRIRYGLYGCHLRKGTVVLLQGRNECLEKYEETVADLNARGLAVAAMDLRGQGGSDRLAGDPALGHVVHFTEYVEDLDQFMRDFVLPDCPGPYFLLAHSTGALIALLAAPMMKNRIERMVLTSPFLGLPERYPFPRLIRLTARLVNSLGLGRLPAQGRARWRRFTPFAGNRLTGDFDRFSRNQALAERSPELFIGSPTFGWLDAFFEASDRVFAPEFPASIHIPALIITAGSDTVVSNRAIERFVLRLRSGSILTIHGARHEILQEGDRYREQFFAAFDAFIPGTRRMP